MKGIEIGGGGVFIMVLDSKSARCLEAYPLYHHISRLWLFSLGLRTRGRCTSSGTEHLHFESIAIASFYLLSSVIHLI